VFTFLSITYNHEKYIIEHLESIKYQVENYGNDKKVNVIICDDASTDKTVYLTEKWLDINKYLFNDVTVALNPSNIGIVKNYFKGINSVKSEKFKALAGDDLYSSNNVFEVQGDCEFAFSYPVMFTENGIDYDKTVKRKYRLDCVRKKTYESIKKFIKNGHYLFLNAPAVFYDIKILQNEELQEFVGQYKWIEDIPVYYYLFAMEKKKDLKISILNKPYVMYRDAVGISNKTTHTSFSVFDIERIQMHEKLNMKVRDDKYLNPYFYLNGFNRYKKLYIDNKIFKKSKNEFAKLKNEIESASVHHEEVKKRVKKFYEAVSYDF